MNSTLPRPLLLMAMLLFIALPLLADPTNTSALSPAEMEDFNPGLGIFAAIIILVMCVAFAFLAGLGMIAGVALCAVAGGLAAFGILSSSVLIGLLRRSPASGFRALFLQLGALLGIPCGMAAMGLVAWLARIEWSAARQLIIGGASGLVCGLFVALLFNFAWTKIAKWVVIRYDLRMGNRATITSHRGSSFNPRQN